MASLLDLTLRGNSFVAFPKQLAITQCFVTFNSEVKEGGTQ